MASLKDPTIHVKKIENDAYRLSIETETMVVKLDLSAFQMMLLVEEALEEVVEHEATLDACSICGDNTIGPGESCEMLHIKEMVMRSVKRFAHVDRRAR